MGAKKEDYGSGSYSDRLRIRINFVFMNRTDFYLRELTSG